MILEPEGTYWFHASRKFEIPASTLKPLMKLECESWLNDLYWGEFIATQYAGMRLIQAPAQRRSIWTRIFQDEMKHFMLVSEYLSDKVISNQKQSPLFVELSKLLTEYGEQRVSLNEVSEYQVVIESLIHRLVLWRKPHVIDKNLKSILEIIEKDELYHIHATTYEQNIPEEVVENSLFALAHRLFPLHFAKRIISLNEFKEVRKIAPYIVHEKLGLNSKTSQGDLDAC